VPPHPPSTPARSSCRSIGLFGDKVPTLATPTLRLAIKFMLLTLVCKSELIGATWDEEDFESSTWPLPKEHMRAGRTLKGCPSDQSIDRAEKASGRFGK